MRGMNPRQMKMAMKRMGIKMEEITGVEEVIIRTKDKAYVLKHPDVQLMVAQGQNIFQVVGDYEITEPSAVSTAVSPGGEGGGLVIPREDVELVVQQTGVSEDEALEALREADGEPAEAIILLMSRRQ
ncbi:MAG: Nascent polypeptide-associated complex protein [Thermoplasmata archaeon]|nr:Nascent polypeptide-associated complex protein [Thermoplasmata archaeon]